ncbi:MAG: phosphate acyltransferase PlsX [candidate division Zixibacteria bacterium]|nr:phosphate acyltransferase PlsX [candidate division Zixibacteria bacterium]
MVRIGLDAMGGDYAPQSIVEGVFLAYKESRDDFGITLVGEKGKIEKELSRFNIRDSLVTIENATEYVGMEESPTEVIKKKNSPIAIGTRLHKEKKVDAFISSGNTGAVMATSLLTLGRLEGVNRPAIATCLPTEKGVVVFLDVGANAECKALNLYQFGIMGSIYASYILKKQSPKVGLLSIGEERTKGNDLVVEAHKLLEKGSVNFVGNVEGTDVLKGTCDVVVTDGFVGNIVLKFAESFDGFLTSLVHKRVKQSLLFRLGAFLLKISIRDLRKVLDYAEYGGAPLLGVNGVCIICHGKSSPKAIMNAIKLSIDMVKERVNEVIKEKLLNNNFNRV